MGTEYIEIFIIPQTSYTGRADPGIEQGEPGLEKLRSKIWGAYQNVRLGLIASAEEAKLRLPKARSSSRLRGQGERRELPQRGLGQSPRNRSDFEHFMPKLSTFWDLVNLRLLTIKSKK